MLSTSELQMGLKPRVQGGDRWGKRLLQALHTRPGNRKLTLQVGASWVVLSGGDRGRRGVLDNVGQHGGLIGTAVLKVAVLQDHVGCL